MSKKIFTILIIFLSLFQFAFYQAQNSKYVSLTGNDKNPCTEVAPCRTITHGIAVAAVGDLVLVSEGTYTENVNVNKNITLQAVGKVILDGTNLPTQSGGGIINIPAGVTVTVQGFEVANGSTYGISVFGNNNKVLSNTIRNIKGVGLWVRDAKNNLFENNEIYYAVLENSVSFNGVNYTCSPTNTAWASAINSWGVASNNIYRGNYVHDNCGEGIVAHPFDVIESNTFMNNWSVEIYIDGSTDVTIRDNFISNTRPYFARGTNQAWRQVPYGISIADESGCVSDRNTITGNVVTNVRYGFSFYNYSFCSGLKNTRIENNTFQNYWEYGIRITAGAHVNSFVRYNTIASSNGAPLTIPSNVTASDNIIASVTTTPKPTVTKTAIVPTLTPSASPSAPKTATQSPEVCYALSPAVVIDGVARTSVCFR
jgi:parallel beta-helix repeat protein